MIQVLWCVRSFLLKECMCSEDGGSKFLGIDFLRVSGCGVRFSEGQIKIKTLQR